MNAKPTILAVVALICAVTTIACSPEAPAAKKATQAAPTELRGSGSDEAPRVNLDWKSPHIPFGLRLAAAAEERATHYVLYDAAYVRIPYPNGDVAPDRGVCSDEVVRAYRLLGIDLQRFVHEDMSRAFQAYPRNWGLSGPDSNIDHRRVPNLAEFFSRKGASVAVSSLGSDYLPGDVVAFALPDGRPHIGIVTQRVSADGKRPLVMHNIGSGPQIEDMLFTLKITGHFRYQGTVK